MSDEMRIVIVCCVLGLGFVVLLLLARIPGSIARRRGHISAEAVNLCGWLGLFLWPCWIIALIWAHTGPDNSPKMVQQKTPPAKPPAGYKGSKSLNFPG